MFFFRYQIIPSFRNGFQNYRIMRPLLHTQIQHSIHWFMAVLIAIFVMHFVTMHVAGHCPFVIVHHHLNAHVSFSPFFFVFFSFFAFSAAFSDVRLHYAFYFPFNIFVLYVSLTFIWIPTEKMNFFFFFFCISHFFLISACNH